MLQISHFKLPHLDSNMATAKNILKNWFSNKKKPPQEQFWAWLESYWHKDEKIPSSVIEGIDEMLQGVATTEQLAALEESKVEKEKGKGLSTNDYTDADKNKLKGIDMTKKLDKGGYMGTAGDLEDMILKLQKVLQSDDVELSKLQQIVEYIKKSRLSLDALNEQVEVNNNLLLELQQVGMRDETISLQANTVKEYTLPERSLLFAIELQGSATVQLSNSQNEKGNMGEITGDAGAILQTGLTNASSIFLQADVDVDVCVILYRR